MAEAPRDRARPGRARFPATRWSLLGRLAEEGPQAEQALASVCEAYWYPLYAHLRRRGHSPDDSQDLTQGFFLSLLRRKDLLRVAPERGRLRSFLLASLDHFASNERDREWAQKRGRDRTLPLEMDDGERRYRLEPVDPRTPEQAFERGWALQILERTLDRLRQDCEKQGKATHFEVLHEHLTGRGDRGDYGKAAAALGLSEGAVRVATHRLRRRFRELLRQEVSRTVGTEDELTDEIRHLMAVLAG